MAIDERVALGRLPLAEAAGDLDAVHAGQIPVHEHDVVEVGLQFGPRVVAVGGVVGLVAEAGEDAVDDEEVVLLVLDDEGARGGGRARALRGRRGAGLRRGHGQRDLEPEGRALARRAGEADGAAHLLGIGAADGQAEAGAADLLLLRAAAAVELFKELRLLVIGDAGPLVAHLDGDLHRAARRVPALDGDLDGAAAGVFEGVGDVVDDDLFDLRLVADDRSPGSPG